MSTEDNWVESCRGCLTKSNLVSIFDERNEIRSKFQEITTILAKQNDGLPAYLCLDCLDTLNFVLQFKKECLKIDRQLRNKLIKKNENKSISMKKTKTRKALESIKNMIDPINIKQETHSEEEIDDNSYYVVIIDEENGEKVVKAVKIENHEAETSESFLTKIKTEIQDESNDDIFQEDIDESNISASVSGIESDNIAQAMVNIHSENTPVQEQLIKESAPEYEPSVREETGAVLEQDRLNLMQVLGGGEGDNGMIQYEEGMSLVGEVISGDLSVQDGSGNEVVVGQVDGEYHIITADGEIAVIGDDEETITVMQQEDGSFLCECGEAYMDFAEYENHIKIHNIYKCGMCDRGFDSNEVLEGHVLLHKSVDPVLQCPFCNQHVKRGMITTHIKLNHNQVRHFCKICKKSFATEPNLKRHMQIHSTNKKFECNICLKRFAQRMAMETHRLSHEDAFLKCALCPQEFATEEECIQHQKEGCVFPPLEGKGVEKPHVCEVCGKSYATAGSLKGHMENAHSTQNSEILCSECGEVLPSRKAMYAHSWAHRQGKLKNAKRFSCETCGKACASHAMLLMHERVHTNERPFHCTKCPLAFKTKTHLTTHQLTHTQEKRFGCSVCMKFFALKGNLVVHLRTHTGERPYVCSICNQGFIDSKYLKKHKQKRHDILNIPWNQYY